MRSRHLVRLSLIIVGILSMPMAVAFGAADTEQKAFGEFTARDLSGDEVTSDIFKEYDLTMVNFWATWCNPCVSEMPEIAELYEELQEEGADAEAAGKANIITVCLDGEEEVAGMVMEDCEAGFLTLVDVDGISDEILKSMVYIPTTLFVDKEGNLVGEEMIGAHSKEEYREAIQSHLEAIAEQAET